MRVVQSFLSFDSLKLIYYSYFHSVLTYGIIFWGNTHYSNAIFKMQKGLLGSWRGFPVENVLKG